MSNLLISSVGPTKAAKLLCFFSASSVDRPRFGSDWDNVSTNTAGMEDFVMLVEKVFTVFGMVEE